MPTTTVYRSIQELKNAPMKKLVLTERVSGDAFHIFYPLSDSTWDVVPITRPDQYGSTRQVGWRMEITFRVLQNDIVTILPGLGAHAGKLFDAVLELAPDLTQVHGRIVSFTLADVGAAWGATKGEYGPIIEITLSRSLTSLITYSSTGRTITFMSAASVIADPAT